MKRELIKIIEDNLNISKVEHEKEKANFDFAQAKKILKSYQVNRLKSVHEDLLYSPDTKNAAQFFLNDIYGSTKMTDRYNDMQKLLPMMEKVFPVMALEVISKAIVLNALTEKLDSDMANTLGKNFSPEEYDNAYITVTSKEDRVKQLELVQDVGLALCSLVRLPLISTTLKVMKFPAKMGGLSDMHDFLEKGFLTFRDTKNPENFIYQVINKEKSILNILYNNEPTESLKLK